MGGGAFILLKSVPAVPESTQQAENRVAVLRKILQIACFWGAIGPRKARKNPWWLHLKRFLGDMANLPQSPALLFSSHFLPENWRSILRGTAAERCHTYRRTNLYLLLH
jgi:hypothetical protein